MKDDHTGISPGHPGGIAPPISSYSWAMAAETEARCRAACLQPGKANALWIPKLIAGSSICTGFSPSFSCPFKKQLRLRNYNFSQRTMACSGIASLACWGSFKGGLTYFKLKLNLRKQLSAKNNNLAENCLTTVQFSHLLTSSRSHHGREVRTNSQSSHIVLSFPGLAVKHWLPTIFSFCKFIRWFY